MRSDGIWAEVRLPVREPIRRVFAPTWFSVSIGWISRVSRNFYGTKTLLIYYYDTPDWIGRFPRSSGFLSSTYYSPWYRPYSTGMGLQCIGTSGRQVKFLDREPGGPVLQFRLCCKYKQQSRGSYAWRMASSLPYRERVYALSGEVSAISRAHVWRLLLLSIVDELVVPSTDFDFRRPWECRSSAHREIWVSVDSELCSCTL